MVVFCVFCEQDGDEDLAASSIPLEDIMVGEEYEGVINNVVSYGAFVDIGTEVRVLTYVRTEYHGILPIGIQDVTPYDKHSRLYRIITIG